MAACNTSSVPHLALPCLLAFTATARLAARGALVRWAAVGAVGSSFLTVGASSFGTFTLNLVDVFVGGGIGAGESRRSSGNSPVGGAA